MVTINKCANNFPTLEKMIHNTLTDGW